MCGINWPDLFSNDVLLLTVVVVVVVVVVDEEDDWTPTLLLLLLWLVDVDWAATPPLPVQ